MSGEQNIEKLIPGVHYNFKDMRVSYHQSFNLGNYEMIKVERELQVEVLLAPEQQSKANIMKLMHDAGILVRKSVMAELEVIKNMPVPEE